MTVIGNECAAEPWNVAVLVGSLRKDGFSARLAEALNALAPSSLRLQRVDIGTLQLFHAEFDRDPPASYVAFREAIATADAVLFVTPEYNRSIPGGLKNALDVGSRPYGEGVLVGKPAAIASQSPGALGGFGANHALRQSLMFLDMPTLAQPEVYLGGSAALLGPGGAVSDEGARCLLAAFMAAFGSWIERCYKP